MSGRRGLVDTKVSVSARNPGESEHETSRQALDLIDAGQLTGAASIAEVRAGLSPAEARAIWQAFTSHPISSKNHELAPVDLSVAELAGDVRATKKLSVPDALIVATGKLQ